VDIGSNTVKMTIAERLPDGSFAPLEQITRTARLGEGTHQRRLTEASIRRTLEALAEFNEACVRRQVSARAAVATSAVRDAVNRDDLIARAAEVGFAIEAVSGAEEAALSFSAVRLDPHWRHVDRLAVIDIGGGSTEIVFGSTGVDFSRSLQLGAVRLTEQALRSDPPSAAQLQEAHAVAASILQQIPIPNDRQVVVGVGGTLTTLLSIHLQLSAPTAEDLHGRSLTALQAEAILQRLAALTTAQRRSIAGLPPERADIILGGAIILLQAMHRLQVESIDVSTRGLRYGLLYNRFGIMNTAAANTPLSEKQIGQ
jgi:exopolyphosphatase/guanosine-5'-triphosphate,3'-diphosphate pyrophosphatase